MVDVGGYNHPPGSDLVTEELGSKLLALGDKDHLFGEQAFARKVHLGHVAVAGPSGFFATLRNPFRARLGHAPAVILAAVI